MMKILGLVLALMVVVTGASMADTATIDIYPGWNSIAAPIAPFNPDPLSVFGGAAEGIDGLLSRYDPSSGNITYDELDPSIFGNVSLGDGYYLNVYTQATQYLTYNGFPDGLADSPEAPKTDMWISLPGAGTEGSWHQIGHPFNHDTPVDPNGDGTGSAILFTDGTDMKTWSEAVDANWVSASMTGVNPASGAFELQYDGLGGDDTFRAARGYWFMTYQPNLAMIIPGN